MFFNLIGRKRKDTVFHTDHRLFSDQPNSFADFCMGQLDICNEGLDADFDKDDTIDTPRRETLTKQLKSVP